MTELSLVGHAARSRLFEWLSYKMIAYVPIDEAASARHACFVSGSASDEAASILLNCRALSEMAGEASVGEVTDCRIVRGSVGGAPVSGVTRAAP
jgi:hypothetical protein